MGIKAFFSKYYAAWQVKKLADWEKNAIAIQDKVLQTIVSQAKDTMFGKDHQFDKINTYEDFKKLVPIRDYEQFREPYISALLNAEENILWPGKPLYFTKTSGTTSGVKYIPISKESMSHHIDAAKMALLSYIHETGNTSFVNGKMIFLQGSPELDKKAGIDTGRLSGIVAHHVPAYLQKNRLPSYQTNCIEDWEEKVDAIVEETISENMTLISGIPPWVQMYFDKLTEKTGKKIKDVFPNFNLFVYGGVNFEPYRAKLIQSIGAEVDTIETYPASEGFIAFQNSQITPGLLLNIDAGIFYEFIPVDEYFNESPTRISLKDVELNKNYAIILNTNAGLWGYSIGDTVKFISKDPYKIIVSGRIKHYISAFGEHVIGEEVEYALMTAAKEENIEIIEFTVAPQVTPEEGGLPYHEWFIEFENEPSDLNSFSLKVDALLQKKNIYYFDLITGNILKPLVIRSLKKNAFIEYMRSEGKLGGQNKVPRLSNDRKIANEFIKRGLTK